MIITDFGLTDYNVDGRVETFKILIRIELMI